MTRRFTTRDFGSPEYKKWRKSVYSRDRYRCRFPGCVSKSRLNAHHIRRWADNPLLRFDVSNGITLCRYHHDIVTGKESEYEQLFLNLISPPDIDIKCLMYKMRKNRE